MEPLGTAAADAARIIVRAVIAAPFVTYGLMVVVAAPTAVAGLF